MNKQVFIRDSENVADHDSPITSLKMQSDTSAVLRLECSIDCISGLVGHQQNIFRSFSHCQRYF